MLADADAGALTLCLGAHDPNFPTSCSEEIQDCSEEKPELEALHRLAMVLHDQYPWDRGQARLQEVGTLDDDDVVVLFTPRTRDVGEFLRRVRRGERPPAHALPRASCADPPGRTRRCWWAGGSRCCRGWSR